MILYFIPVTTPGTSRYSTCSELIGCIQTCVNNQRGDFASCKVSCDGESSATAQSHYNELLSCLGAMGSTQGLSDIEALWQCYLNKTCNSFYDDQCMSEQCQEEFGRCL